MTNLKDLLAALTEEERAAISEHDADSPLGRMAEECRKLEPEAVEVPVFWLKATSGGRVSVSESNDQRLWLWILGPEPGLHAGLHISRKEALELANALLVAAAAMTKDQATLAENEKAILHLKEQVRVLREALVESNHMLRHHVEDWDETGHTYEDIDAALEQTAQALAATENERDE